MIIKWLGHSSFLMLNNQGMRLLTDPYDASVGYELTYPEAEVVTVSHHHHDHDALDTVRGSFQVVDEPGEYSLHGFEIRGLPSYHDEHEGALRGLNTVFVISADGLRICHLGDLGHVPGERLLADIGEVDVLMVPTGGTYTLDEKGAKDTCELIDAKLVIPMHYKTRDCALDLSPVVRFVELMKKNEYSISDHCSNELELPPEWLPKRPKVMVMEYK